MALPAANHFTRRMANNSIGIKGALFWCFIGLYVVKDIKKACSLTCTNHLNVYLCLPYLDFKTAISAILFLSCFHDVHDFYAEITEWGSGFECMITSIFSNTYPLKVQ